MCSIAERAADAILLITFEVGLAQLPDLTSAVTPMSPK